MRTGRAIFLVSRTARSASAHWALWCCNQAFTDCLLAGVLTSATDSFTLFANALLRRLLEIVAELHFTENAFTLKTLLQNAEGLIDIVVADLYLQKSILTWCVA
jgi:hypothetical protein